MTQVGWLGRKTLTQIIGNHDVTFTALRVILADDKLMIVFLFLPEK